MNGLIFLTEKKKNMSEVLNFSINGASKTAAKYVGKSRNFTLTIDEPHALGGQDEAPNPVEYLLAGYAGCLNVVVHLVAKELGITVQSLNLGINGDIDPAKLFGQSNAGRAGFIGLQVDINIDTDASEGQLSRLFELVKDRCPVNDNISNATPVRFAISRDSKLIALAS